ncbi:MAG: TIGR02301 family protein [Rhizobiaceae bacterium]|nr:TIGR02301 family protein [Rhizobiaceae bacterium]
MRTAIALLVALLLAGLPARQAHATDGPFEPGLIRLSEILGSLHFLRNLCGEKGVAWREQMEALIAAEKPDPARKARFIASFNHGYRTFQTTYTTCTPAAAAAIERYTKEGEQLSREIAVRYGN